MKMSVHFDPYLLLLCIFMCISCQNVNTSEDQAVPDTITNVKTSVQDSLTTVNDISRLDKKNGENQSIRYLSKTSASYVALTNQNNSTATIAPTTTTDTIQVKPITQVNSDKNNKYTGNRNIGTGAVIRGFYVFVGLGAIVVMYIIVRTIRLKRKKTTVRKYGVLANREDVEMTPLGAEDEEEESTLFDMTKSRP